MRSLKYLNTVLTIIAVLLSLHLWTIWSLGSFGFSQSAQAQTSLPDPGAQRNEMINQLRSLNDKITELNAQFRSGSARVRVESMPEK